MSRSDENLCKKCEINECDETGLCGDCSVKAKAGKEDEELRAEHMLDTGKCVDCDCYLNDDGFCWNCNQYKIQELRPLKYDHGK